MGDLIVVGILVVVIGLAVRFIWKEKKKGTRCIGCSSAGCCCVKGNDKEKAGCGCHSDKS